MKRRAFLASGAVAALAGCLGGGDSTNNQSSFVDDFETTTTNGYEIPLAPVETTHEWYQNDEARFADARGRTSYEASHVEGAVLSTAQSGFEGDPVAEWSKDTTIVAYCGCPHHLSSIRASTLIEKGYENVAVIDEGFWTWYDRGYPVAGTDVQNRPASYEISGQTDATYAGESAWAFHDPTGQREATPIESDGSYSMELKFADVSADSPIRVTTPGYEVEYPLGDLTDGVVAGH